MYDTPTGRGGGRGRGGGGGYQQGGYGGGGGYDQGGYGQVNKLSREYTVSLILHYIHRQTTVLKLI